MFSGFWDWLSWVKISATNTLLLLFLKFQTIPPREEWPTPIPREEELFFFIFSFGTQDYNAYMGSTKLAYVGSGGTGCICGSQKTYIYGFHKTCICGLQIDVRALKSFQIQSSMVDGKPEFPGSQKY